METDPSKDGKERKKGSCTALTAGEQGTRQIGVG